MSESPIILSILFLTDQNILIYNCYWFLITDQSYDIYLTGTPPQSMRVHLLTPTDMENEQVRLCVYMDGLMRPDVYVNETYVLAINAARNEQGNRNTFLWLLQFLIYI